MTDRERRRRLSWTAVIFLTVAIGGAGLQVRGALAPTFVDVFQVSEAQLGLLAPVGVVGFVVPVLLLGMAAGRLPIKRTLLVGLLLMGVTFVLLGTTQSFAALLLFAGLRTAAFAFVRALDRPVIGHLYPDGRGRMFTTMEMSWAAGATLGPVLVTVAIAVDSWRLTYYVLGALVLAVAVVAWRLEFPDGVGAEQTFTLGDLRPLFARPAIVGMVLTVVVVGSIESTIFTWLPYYADDFLPRSTANLALSVFLVAYVPGRLGFSRLADRYSPPDIVLAGSVVLAGLLAVLFGSGGLPEVPFLVTVFAAGFFVSGFFPLLLTWGVEAAPEYTGPVNAVALTAAQAGFFVVPATVGVLADAYSIQTAMMVEIGLGVALVVVLGGYRLLGGTREA